MATIDPSIAMGVRPVQIESPLNQLAAVSQIQSGQNQNALAQYQLASAQRADESTNIQNQLYAKHYDPTTGKVNTQGLYSDLAKSPVTAGLIPKLQAQDVELKYKQDQGKKIVSEISKLNFETGSKIFGEAQNELKQIDPRNPNAPAQYLAYRERLYANPELADFFAKTGMTKEATDAQVRQAIQTPQGLADAILKSMTTADQFQKILQDREQLKVSQGQLSVSQGQLGVAQGNLGVSQQRLAADLDPNVQAKLAASKAAGTTTGKTQAAAAIALPNAIATSESLLGKIDAMIGTPAVKDKSGKVINAGTAPHPGFTGAVGMGRGYTLGIPGVEQLIPGTPAADFKARFDEIMGGAFLEAFETLKGGGAITETEGKKATAAKTRMSLAQSENEFLAAAREYKDIVKTGIERARKKAGQAPSGGVDYDALVNKYTQ
jgi:hypothetical protein